MKVITLVIWACLTSAGLSSPPPSAKPEPTNPTESPTPKYKVVKVPRHAYVSTGHLPWLVKSEGDDGDHLCVFFVKDREGKEATVGVTASEIREIYKTLIDIPEIDYK